MAGRKEYEYQLMDRATERQDDWYLQQRREISEEESDVNGGNKLSEKDDENKNKSVELNLAANGNGSGDKKEKKNKEAGKNGNIPFPFPNEEKVNKKSKHSLKEKKVARLTAKRERNKPAISTGDEQGVLKGLISNQNINKTLLKAGFINAKVEGKPVEKVDSDTKRSENEKTDDDKIIEAKDKIEVELKDEKKPEDKQLLQPAKTEKPPELLRAPVITVDTTQLKKDAGLQKKQLQIAVNKEEQKFAKNATLHRKSIDKEYSKQVTSVTHDYDGAIRRVKQTLKTAQAQVAKGKIEKRALLIKNAADRTAQVDSITTAKQNELTLLGNEYGNTAKAHAGELINEAAKRYQKGKATIEKNAADAISPYANHEYYADVKYDVNEMADEIKKNLVTSTLDLQKQLKEDGIDIAEKFHDDAAEGASKMPDGKEASKKNIANILAEGIKQFDGVSTKPLQELASRVNNTVAELQKNKKETLDNLRKQKDDADKKINDKESEGKKAIRTQNDKLVNSIDTIVGDTEKDSKTLKPEFANQLIEQATVKIKETSSLLDQTVVMVHKAIDEQQLSIVSGTLESFRNAGKEASKNANTIAGNSEKGGKQTSDNMIASYSDVVKQLTDGMDGELKHYSAELDKTIQECRVKFDEELAVAKTDMNTKAYDVFAENDQMVADSRKQLKDAAKDASEISLWDVFEAIGSFLLGVLKAIGLILLVLAAILLIIAVLVALFYGLLALIAYFGGAALSMLLLTMAEIFVAYLLEVLAAYTIYFIVIGVAISLKMYYDKATDKTLTRNQKAEGYGEATVYLLTSFLGSWGQVKGLITTSSRVAEAEAAVLNIAKEEMALTNIAKEELAVTNIAKEEAAVTNIAKEEGALLSTTSKPQLLLGPGRQTNYTLDQIRRMRGAEKWQEGEVYVQQLHGSAGQQRFPVPKTNQITGTGGRYVDAPVNMPNGNIMANEVKLYNKWITKNGVPVRNEVPLSPKIEQQILKDVWLRENVAGYDPRWIFLESPPSEALRSFLIENKIIFVVHL